jgi:hypothetical protein
MILFCVYIIFELHLPIFIIIHNHKNNWNQHLQPFYFIPLILMQLNLLHFEF